MRTVTRFLARLVQVAGVLVLGYSAFILVQAHLFQAHEQQRFERATGSNQSAESAAPTAPVPDTMPQFPLWDPGTGTAQRTAPKPDALIGRIEIPRLHMSTMILEGDDERELRLGAGHVPGTTLPGSTGNVVIAAHRDTFFRPLQDISKDDRIVLTTLAGTFQYAVDYFGVTNPENTTVMRASADPALTLITCYPFFYVGPAPKRFIVRARLIE